VRRNYAGTPLDVLIADPLGRGWYDHDWGTQVELDLLRRHALRPGATVFDLGAHHGVVALMLGAIVSPGGRVIALEAEPFNASIARENASRNPQYRVEVLNAAISDQAGELVFTRDGHVAADDDVGIRVPCFTIDDLATKYGRPDVIFVDVEGFECQALRGASRTLATRPDCFVEVHVGKGLERFGSVTEVLSHFPEAHYERWASPIDANPALVPYDASLPFVRERFMLVAIARRD
jgi:FkbM family methyltransferase